MDAINLPRHELMDHITFKLHESGWEAPFIHPDHSSLKPSAVLFMLAYAGKNNGTPKELCLVLNKRSKKIKQGGDLCCPGGSIETPKDTFGAHLLKLPFSPLKRWPYFYLWRSQKRTLAQKMALFFATGLRESIEEIRLNPFGVKFLGPLPSESLRLFKKVIHPMVVEIKKDQRFVLNGEVDRIVNIPIRSLLNPENYARFRLTFNNKNGSEDFPCFIYEGQHSKEILWGATHRITMNFLNLIFQFQPPHHHQLPVIERHIGEVYLRASEKKFYPKLKL